MHEWQILYFLYIPTAQNVLAFLSIPAHTGSSVSYYPFATHNNAKTSASISLAHSMVQYIALNAPALYKRRKNSLCSDLLSCSTHDLILHSPLSSLAPHPFFPKHPGTTELGTIAQSTHQCYWVVQIGSLYRRFRLTNYNTCLRLH